MRGCACRWTSGFAHVSCLAEQAKILVAEAEENNLGNKVVYERFGRWHSCRLCEQQYHGVVRGALGWACWKTYLGRSEGQWVRTAAMNALGLGLDAAEHYEEALSVKEAELAMKQRLGASENSVLATMSNLATAYKSVGRSEEALRMERDIYSIRLKVQGEEYEATIIGALNYSSCLMHLERFKEAKALLRRTIPVARRVLGESNNTTLKLRKHYVMALYNDPCLTLDDLREAANELEDLAPTALRVLGSAHPDVGGMEDTARRLREAVRAGETLLRAREEGGA